MPRSGKEQRAAQEWRERPPREYRGRLVRMSIPAGSFLLVANTVNCESRRDEATLRPSVVTSLRSVKHGTLPAGDMPAPQSCTTVYRFIVTDHSSVE